MSEEEAEAEHKHDFEIVVNTKAHNVHDESVSYEQVVEFAYPGGLADSTFIFAVDYEKAKESPHDGSLVAGQHVEVKRNGTEFSVIRSVRS
ncbi:MAG: multiubiquitin domain-containing protein [Actinomycetota bacterium]|nr:multiubiquitin domain-containing protein [Actinomycetota bacterium]